MNIAYNMDCLDGMKSLDDCCIDLTVTSPPYDNIRDYNGFTFDWKSTIKQIYRVTKDGGVVVWIVNDQTVNGSETGTSFRQALYAKECGFNLHDTMIWDKNALRFPCETRYHDCFEYMFVFSKGAPKTHTLIEDRVNVWGGAALHGTDRQKDGSITPQVGNGKRNIKEVGKRFNVWHMSAVQSSLERTGHRAQFPLALARDHIISWSKEGDTVMDPFLGSGTTRIAAYDLNRKFIGYEISKEYFDKQEERFAAYTAQQSLFVGDGAEQIGMEL